jgi:hypothetical protein
MNDEISIVLKARDDASKTIEEMGKKTKSSFADIGKQVSGAMAIAGGAITAFMASTIEGAGEAEKANKMLEHAVIGISNATKEQFEATQKLADELERKGVLDGDNIKIGLAQLSTFGLSNTAVQGLGKSLSDLAVNQFGVNASGDQLAQTANVMAKALQGQFGVLEKSGIRFTEAQQAIIKTGTEMEKVKAINEGLAQNLKYTNDVALTTFEGGMAKLKVQVDNVKEAVGTALMPILQDLGAKLMPIIQSIQDWVAKNPALFEQIVKFTAIAGVALTVIGAIGLALPAIITGFTLLFSPVGLVIGAIGLLVGVLFKLYTQGNLTLDFLKNIISTIDQQTGLVTVLKEAWNGIVTAFNEKFRPAIDKLWKALEPFVPYLQLFAKVVGAVLVGALIILVELISKSVILVMNLLAGVINFLTGAVNLAKGAFEGFVNVLASIIDWAGKVIDKIEGMISALKRAKDATFGAVGNAFNTAKSAIGLANGGVVSQPTYALIGEGNEPEAVMPLSQLRSMIGAGGGGGATVNIYGGSYLSEDVARDLGGKIIDMLKLNRKL